MIGRQREIAVLWHQIELARAGGLRVALLAGEPGIGKTQLLRELARRAAVEGITVLRGGASDAEGMPPYLPFLEALGRYIRAADPAELRAQVGALFAPLAALLPELADRLGDPTAGYPLPTDQARLRLYDALGDFLAAIGAQRGLLLLIDDLQWADPATLDLICHIARRHGLDGTPARLLILGAYREGEVDAAHPLAPLLWRWREHAEVRHLRLVNLPVSDHVRVWEPWPEVTRWVVSPAAS